MFDLFLLQNMANIEYVKVSIKLLNYLFKSYKNKKF